MVKLVPLVADLFNDEEDVPMQSFLGGRQALWIAGAAALGVATLASVLPNASAQSPVERRSASPTAVSQTICESDGPEQGDFHRIVLRDRGSRPGVKATFYITGAVPDRRWDFEVSVTSGGSEEVKVGSKRTGGKGKLSFSLVNKTPGRAYAESGLSPHDGSEYCSMTLKATV